MRWVLMFTRCMVCSAPQSVLIRTFVLLVNMLRFGRGTPLMSTARLMTIRFKETIALPFTPYVLCLSSVYRFVIAWLRLS